MIRCAASIVILILTPMLNLGQVAAPKQPAALTLCRIFSAPTDFDGRDVVATGVAGNSFHQTDFWDPECPLPKHGGAARLRFAEGYVHGPDKRYLGMLRKYGAVRLVVRGRFVASGGPFGPEGDRFEFQIVSIIEVQKLTREYRDRYSIGTGKF